MRATGVCVCVCASRVVSRISRQPSRGLSILCYAARRNPCCCQAPTSCAPHTQLGFRRSGEEGTRRERGVERSHAHVYTARDHTFLMLAHMSMLSGSDLHTHKVSERVSLLTDACASSTSSRVCASPLSRVHDSVCAVCDAPRRANCNMLLCVYDVALDVLCRCAHYAQYRREYTMGLKCGVRFADNSDERAHLTRDLAPSRYAELSLVSGSLKWSSSIWGVIRL